MRQPSHSQYKETELTQETLWSIWKKKKVLKMIVI